MTGVANQSHGVRKARHLPTASALATLAATVFLLVACTSGGGSGRLVFTSMRDGNPEVYSSQADGEDPQRLTNTQSIESRPAWSPNGQRIAFLSDRNGQDDLWIMDAEGESEERAVGSDGVRSAFSWAPDSKRIAYVSDQDGNVDIYVVDLAKNQMTQLTNSPAIEDLGGWSPQGEWVVYGVLVEEGQEAEDGGAQGIHKENPLGVDEIQLTEKPDYSPQWSPKGDKIAFQSMRDGDVEIYVMDEDGQNETNLTKKPGDDRDFDWSPDGKRIVFISERDGNPEIYVVTLDGRLQRLTHNTVEERSPRWAANGNRIVFASSADGDFDLYTMKRDGSDQKRVTATDADDLGADW